MYKIDSESTEGEKEDERGEVSGGKERKGLTGKPNRPVLSLKGEEV